MSSSQSCFKLPFDDELLMTLAVPLPYRDSTRNMIGLLDTEAITHNALILFSKPSPSSPAPEGMPHHAQAEGGRILPLFLLQCAHTSNPSDATSQGTAKPSVFHLISTFVTVPPPLLPVGVFVPHGDICVAAEVSQGVAGATFNTLFRGHLR